MDKKNVVFKCYSSGDSDVVYINGSHINKVTAKSGKLGDTPYVKLFIEYYDVEFCVNTLLICDTIEHMENDD